MLSILNSNFQIKALHLRQFSAYTSLAHKKYFITLQNLIIKLEYLATTPPLLTMTWAFASGNWTSYSRAAPSEVKDRPKSRHLLSSLPPLAVRSPPLTECRIWSRWERRAAWPIPKNNNCCIKRNVLIIFFV